MTRIDFRILGPLEVRVSGESLPLGGPKQRALLAILLLSANRVVSRERLIDELWPNQGAAAADSSLRVAIGRLRRALSADEEARLTTRSPGYVLRVEPGELDLHRFEERVAAGRRATVAGDLGTAAAELREGEALWNGRPLADLEFEPFARVEVERLAELRLAAIEERIEAELALGRHAALVGELEALVADQPLRERFRAQLMRALYANARQAEALSVYADTRKLLVEELGIEPGEELRELERKVLNQDPGLRAAPPSRRHEAAGSDDQPQGEASRRRHAIVAAVAAAAVAIAGVIALLQAGDESAPPLPLPSVAFIDAGNGKQVGSTPGNRGPIVQWGAGAVWQIDDYGTVTELDPRTFRQIRSIAVGLARPGSAVGFGALWVMGGSQILARVEPHYGGVTRFRLPRRGLLRPTVGGRIAVGAGSIWVAQGQQRVLRIDPATGRVQHSFNVPNAQVPAYGDGALWVASSDLGKLTRIDPRTNSIAATARIGPWICCVAVGGGYVWAANDTGLWKLSEDGDPVATIKLATEAGEMSYGSGAVWLTVGDTFLRVDPQANVVRRYRLGHFLAGIATNGGRVATSVFPDADDKTAGLSGEVLHGAFVAIGLDVTDPALSGAPGVKNWATEQQLQRATCSRLLNHPDAPAPAGWRLVPEIAAALPTVSADGRTYTFRVRRGYRFSPPSNEPVTAGTFKYSIERALAPELGPNAPALALASDIVGVDAYRHHAARGIAGIRANGESLSITLTRPAPDFPERIAASYFCPVPIGTPVVAEGIDEPIPSAGPYYLSANFPAVLRQNPNYHGDRARSLDAIVFSQQAPLSSTVSRIEAGSTDYAAELGPALAPDTPVARRFGGSSGRYVQTPLLGTDVLAFDPRHGLLRDAHVRRAINEALDRRALASALDDLVTDRYLPPGMPGYRPQRINPLHDPDLARARALMAGRTGRLSLAICDQPHCVELGRIVRFDLHRIGLDITLRRYGGEIDEPTRRRGADIVLARVLARDGDPIAFLRSALRDARPIGRLAAAARLDIPQRQAVAAPLERDIRHDLAPLAAFGTPAIPEFFSARVGCKVFPPLTFGVDLGQLCLRSS